MYDVAPSATAGATSSTDNNAANAGVALSPSLPRNCTNRLQPRDVEGTESRAPMTMDLLYVPDRLPVWPPCVPGS